MDEAREWVGRSGDPFFAEEPINKSMIQFYASMVRDANPSYWDESFATECWGGIRSPPGMLWTWKMKPQWTPSSDETDAEDITVTDVPLPDDYDTIINTQSKTTFYRPMLAGTTLNWVTGIESVSDEKETRLGPGHFITEKTTYRDEEGKLVADESNVMLRYSGSESQSAGEKFENEPYADGRRSIDINDDQWPADRYESLDISEVAEGDTVAGFEFPTTYRRVIHSVAATRDFTRLHHDPEFSRSRGNETIFMNTMALQGIVDRAAIQWSGPDWRISERELSMRGTAVAGDRLDVSGEVTEVNANEDAIQIQLSVEKGNRDICPTSVTLVRN